MADISLMPNASAEEKKRQLFLNQRETLDAFLARGAITQAQYDKSLGDLIRLMGMEELALLDGVQKAKP